MINDELHVVHARAAGLDIHKMQVTATVRLCQTAEPEPRCVTRIFSALPNGLRKLKNWLLGHQVQAAAMEATGIYWTRSFDVLSDAGLEVSLYHPQQVKQLRGRKTDIQDARWLARVCQFGLGQPSYVPTKLFRDLRQISRYRRKLVEQRSQVRNQVHKQLDRCGLLIGGILTDVFGVNGRRILDGIMCGRSSEQILDSLTVHVRAKRERFEDALQANLNERVRFLLRELLLQHDSFEARITQADLMLEQQLQPYQDQLDLLCTIPGISREAAASAYIEIGGDLNAFPNARSFAAWSGTAPGNNESAGKHRSGRTRHGNPHLRMTLIESAHAAARCKGSQYQHFHRALTVRRGYKRATVATAHKLARTLYAVLRDQQPYRDPQADYAQLLVRRNAPRWVCELKKFGILQRNREGSYVLDWSAQLNL